MTKLTRTAAPIRPPPNDLVFITDIHIKNMDGPRTVHFTAGEGHLDGGRTVQTSGASYVVQHPEASTLDYTNLEAELLAWLIANGHESGTVA